MDTALINKLRPVASSTFQVNGMYGVNLSMYHPNGESVTVFLRRSGDELWASDCRTGARSLQQNGVRVPEDDSDFGKHLRLMGLTYFQGEVSVKGPADSDPVRTVHRVAEGSLAVSNRVHSARGPTDTTFIDEVARAVVRILGPETDVARSWVDPVRDEHGAFPVDLRVNGSVSEKHLHLITSHGKADRAAMSAFFHKQAPRPPETVMIVAPGFHVGETSYVRIAAASDHVLNEFSEPALGNVLVRDSNRRRTR